MKSFLTTLILLITLGHWAVAAPVIDPIPAVSVPAGKSLILPITATSTNGRALTYTITSSSTAFAVVQHTNDPFWQLTVAQAAPTNAPGAYFTPYRGGTVAVTNVGTLTFQLFPEYAPHAVNVFQGLTYSGFYNSNTIFHRVVTNFVIQGGDPLTNGLGGLTFQYNSEFNPQAIFSGNGQLALANSGKNTCGCQFFVTIGQQRFLDFDYTLFGQLVRGFSVLTNIQSTAVDSNSRPLADEIIQTARLVQDPTDAVITLTAANQLVNNAVITVVADDGAGGRATNRFLASSVTDTNDYGQPFIASVTNNLVWPTNTTSTNFFTALQLNGQPVSWFPEAATSVDQGEISGGSYNLLNYHYNNLTYNFTNQSGQLELFIHPTNGYRGPITIRVDVSANTNWFSIYNNYPFFGQIPPYDEQYYTLVFGDTPITAQPVNVNVLASQEVNGSLLAQFTNGVPGSAATNFTAKINWGDNTKSAGVVTATTSGTKTVTGTHNYQYPGSYPAYVQVSSSVGASATVVSLVNVEPYGLLTFYTNGLGSITPDLGGQVVVPGSSLSLTATPKPGFKFVNWTNATTGTVSTNPVLNFVVATNYALTATFANSLNPVATVTNIPASGLVVSNAVFTMQGTATDNWAVAYVFAALGTNPWQLANGTNSWSKVFVLNPGTNYLRSYAVDPAGNASPTNISTIVYVQTASLALATNGLGSLTPAYAGQNLRIGQNYPITATPANGFKFVNWTNSLSGAVFTNTSLTFNMQSNLLLTATFADTNRPYAAITNVPLGLIVSNATFTVSGRATDNWAVASVSVQLGTNGWVTPTGLNPWSQTFTLQPGTNLLSVSATDTSGNQSLTNTATVVYVQTASLALATNGLGTIAPTYTNQLLRIGQNYPITATPANGFKFVNWTNSLSGAVFTNASLTFNMQSNLLLTATFADTNRPYAAITNVPLGLIVSNATFTVSGRATDNWAVASVAVQLGTNGWVTPTGLNPWSQAFTLQPGTNLLSVSATDTSGNQSLTNTATVVYVQTASLALATNGLGMIAPTYTNQLLRIGQNYPITATPANGFKFVNWTNSLSGAVFTNTSLTFNMQSNLLLTATFAETNRPSIAITNLVNGQVISNSLYTVAGTATDLVAVASVWVQVAGSGNWLLADGTRPWSLPVSLASGSNSIAVYAVNAGGISSLTNTVTIKSSIPSLTPGNLNGVVLAVTPQGASSSLQVSFGASTFAQTATDTNDNNGVGTYTYVRQTTNLAQISIRFTAPPLAVANQSMADNVVLAYTNLNGGVFTDLVTSVTGNFAVVSPAGSVSLPTVNQTAYFIDVSGNAIAATTLAGGQFSAVEWQTGNTNYYGYSALAYSPECALVTISNSLGLDYIVTTSVGTNYGTYYIENYDRFTNLNASTGVYVYGSTAAAGNAPLQIASTDAQVYQMGDVFDVNFGTKSFSQLDVQNSSNFGGNGIGTYIYSRNGLNNGQITFNYTNPPTAVTNAGSSTVGLDFVAPGVAIFTNFTQNIGSDQYGTATYLGSYEFTGGSDGAGPAGGLVLANGVLYGTAANGGSNFDGTIFSVNPDGSGFQLLHTFSGTVDGASPQGSLLLAGNTLYGTVQQGGADGFGGIFSINTNGSNFKLLYSFTNGTDGAYPQTSLTLAGGRLCGAATAGGSDASLGTIFALNTNGTGFTTLHIFTNGADGSNPWSDLLAVGNRLYGTTKGDSGASSYGGIYALNANGTGFTNLYAFQGGNDGSGPQGGLALVGSTLYGTAYDGGADMSGTVFAIKTNGTGFNVVYTFTGTNDGAYPQGDLLYSGGQIYGTTYGAGAYGGGTVYAIDPTATNGGNFNLLYAFGSNIGDGMNPLAGVTASGANLYGTAQNGAAGSGSVYGLNATLPMTFGAVALSPSSALAPASMGGRTLIATSSSGAGSPVGVMASAAVTLVFNTNGTFNQVGLETGVIGGNGTSGTYSYTVASPTGALLQLNFTGGNTEYLQLGFSASGSGNYYLTTPTQTDVGTFTLRSGGLTTTGPVSTAP